MTDQTTCRCCGVAKPTDQFYLRKETGRRRTDCKTCFNARVTERAKANPDQRMRTRLREALVVAGGKRGRSWEIDHIVALASFDIREAGDAEFRAAWSLGNLRPLWRGPNRAKSSRREFLL